MTINLLLNVTFTLLWLLLTQNTSFLNGVFGFILGAVVVTLGARAAGKPPYLGRLFNLARFIAYFLYILVKANLDVAWEIITPSFTMKPRMIRYDVRGLSEVQVTALANAITLTPGTLSADVDDKGEFLYIHAMYAEKAAAAVAEPSAARPALLIVATIGIGIMVVGILLCLYRMIKGPHLADRVLAGDTMAMLVAGLVILLAVKYSTSMFYDAALVVSILGFASTVAFAQYIGAKHKSCENEPTATDTPGKEASA